MAWLIWRTKQYLFDQLIVVSYLFVVLFPAVTRPDGLFSQKPARQRWLLCVYTYRIDYQIHGILQITSANIIAHDSPFLFRFAIELKYFSMRTSTKQSTSIAAKSGKKDETEIVSGSKTFITKKFHIEVPLDKYENECCLYRIWFGKGFLWWKSLSLRQGVQMIAEQIERQLRTGNTDDTSYLYHVVNHIKRTRCIKAEVEVFRNDVEKNGSIDVFKLLKLEQQCLDADVKNPDCLNNNIDAYIPSWIQNKHVAALKKFNQWKRTRK